MTSSADAVSQLGPMRIAGIDENARAEEMSLEEFDRLALAKLSVLE